MLVNRSIYSPLLTPTVPLKEAVSNADFLSSDFNNMLLERRNLSSIILNIKERIARVRDAIKDETNNFVGFWTERNTSNTKMRFELQQTFDIGRRLATWVKNNKEWKINKKEKDERKEMQFTGS